MKLFQGSLAAALLSMVVLGCGGGEAPAPVGGDPAATADAAAHDAMMTRDSGAGSGHDADATEAPAEGEGEAPAEGEGEAPAEGEGAAPAEGEGAAPTEGEAPAEESAE